MGTSVHAEPLVRFQDFKVNLETGEVWKNGIRLKLQDQPFKVLATLLRHSGQIVTREELRQLIWPQESFGDFDHAINLAVTKLRNTLGDSADVPHLIETLPRRGYRFIGLVAPPASAEPVPVSAGKPRPVATVPPIFSGPKARWFAAGAMCVLVVALAVIKLLPLHHSNPPLRVQNSIIPLEPGQMLDSILLRPPWGMDQPNMTAITMSGDDRFVVYVAIDRRLRPEDKPQLYLRKADQLEAEPIKGAEGAIGPFLSPDDRWIGFWADGTLMKVSIDGRILAKICDQSLPFGAAWGPDNTIVMAGRDTGLFRVSANGGIPEKLTTPDKLNDEYSHRLPHWLPNGKGILFTITREWFDQHPRIALLDLSTKKWRVLLEDAADVHYVRSGHLVFLHQGVLMAVPFDLHKQQMTGQPFPVVPIVIQSLNTAAVNTAAGQFTVSDSGSLLYATGGILPDRQNSLVWVDKKGNSQTITAFKAPFYCPRLSPDGSRIAYITEGAEWLVWVYDLNRGTATRLLQEGKSDFPLWTPDGTHIVLKYWRAGEPNLFWIASDGSAPLERLATSNCHQIPGSFTPDGSVLAFPELCPDTGWDINLLDMKTRRVTKFLSAKANELYPEFSPGGRWLAYVSDESGRREVYVRPFPGPGAKWQISTDGGINPIWSRDGKRLFYIGYNERDYWTVDIRSGETFSAGKPQLMFTSNQFEVGEASHTWDVSLDGQRFLLSKFGELESRPVTELILVENWFEELKHLAPTPHQ